jgi:hypothetical protein
MIAGCKRMKKTTAILSLAFVAFSANASTIQIQSASFSEGSFSLGSFSTASGYANEIDAAVSAPGAKSYSVASYDWLDTQGKYSAFKATVNFGVATAGTWEVRAGVDFGGGGAIFMDGAALATKSSDMWWNSTYSDPTQIFDVSKNLAVGNHTLTIYGIEYCCSGYQQTQFKAAGSSDFVSFSNRDGLVAAVPEPETYAMLLAGLGLIGFAVKGRKAKQA